MSNNPGYAKNKVGHGPAPDHQHEQQLTSREVAAIRREQAVELQAKRDKRSDKEQLAVLIERGHPNCREALRLAKKIGGGV